MTTVFVGHRPPEIESWLERRRALGQDRLDEVWEGVYHVAPGPTGAHAVVGGELAIALAGRAKQRGLRFSTEFNVGVQNDFRVPDAGVHRGAPGGTFLDTAAMVIEVLSPEDETFAKFGFYAARRVDEILVADPQARTVRIWQLRDGSYEETGRSDLLDVSAEAVAAEIDWP